MTFDFKKLLPHLVSLVVMIIVGVMMFLPQFQGKKLQQGDVLQYRGAVHEIQKYREITHEDDILWTNSMFGGMPSFGISVKTKNSLANKFQKPLGLWFPRPMGVFLFGMISFYIAMILMHVNPWIALITSLLFAFAPGNMVTLAAGHNTKIMAIMASAPIVAGVIMFMKERRWISLLVFTLFLGLGIDANHPQMTYYLGMTLIIYMIIALVDAIKKGEILTYLKSAGLLVVGALLAVGMSANKLLPLQEYGKHTMRGKPILENTDPTSSSGTDGLAWDYAMAWSAGPLDILSTFIPRAAGGGSMEKMSKSSSKFAKATRQNRVPAYFGSLPFTAGPYYFGAIVFFLFVFSLLGLRSRIRWWLGGAALLIFMISMGKNFEFFNKLLFDYFPLYNKFRTPNSVFSIFGVILLTGMALILNKISKAEDKTKYIKPLIISGGIVGGIALLMALLGPSMISFDHPGDARMGLNAGLQEILEKDRAALMTSSAWRTLLDVLFSVTILYNFLKSKLSFSIVLPLLGIISFYDIAYVNRNYFNKDNWVSERSLKNSFVMRDADKQILKDKDPHYRVQDFTVDTYNNASTSYYHKTIGGYHAAKLQRIQDIIDRHLSQRSQERPYGNQKVLNMLNTKYFIVPGPDKKPQAQHNPAALGNAWFVEDIKMVNSADEEIEALNNFDPLSTAIVHKEFADYIGNFDPQKAGTIKLTKYLPDELEYESDAPSDQLAVFSEVWYGPNLGWKAYIDGKSAEHIRANYILRAMKIPAGKHKIKFEFKPKSRETGKMISLISSLIVLAMMGFAVYKEFKK